MKKIILIFCSFFWICAKATNTNEAKIILIVDYSQTLKQMIAGGNYVWRSYIDEKMFPLPVDLIGTKDTCEAYIFHFKKDMLGSEAVKEMEKAGYRPATLPELLALGKSNPDLQRQSAIIALGQIWKSRDGKNIVPYLDNVTGRRVLYLYDFEGLWPAGQGFLGIKK